MTKSASKKINISGKKEEEICHIYYFFTKKKRYFHLFKLVKYIDTTKNSSQLKMKKYKTENKLTTPLVNNIKR